MSRTATLSLILVAIATIGCDDTPELDLAYVADKPQPVPVVDLPVSMRVENWTGKAYRHVCGSCVHASTINTFRSSGRSDLERIWHRKRNQGYAGPETGHGIMAKLRAENVSFAWTDAADTSLFEWSTATRRQGMVFTIRHTESTSKSSQCWPMVVKQPSCSTASTTLARGELPAKTSWPIPRAAYATSAARSSQPLSTTSRPTKAT